MIGRSDERWSGISVLAARDDDDDDSVLVYHGYNNTKIDPFSNYLCLSPVDSKMGRGKLTKSRMMPSKIVVNRESFRGREKKEN